MKNIVVTGGAGFIGSHLCRKLLEDEATRVFCIDNLYTGTKENIKDLEENRRFHFIKANICVNWHQLIMLDLTNIDEIYNLACPASPVHYQAEHALETLDTNYIGMKNVLMVAQQRGAKVLQASTSEVYGDPEVHPQYENYRGNVNTYGPRACYDEGKRVAETLCFEYRQRGVDVNIVRIFNTYGPNMRPDDGRVVSNFICQAINGKDLTVYGSGMQTRSFCYVSDLVDGLIKAMNRNYGYPINLGNPGEFTVLELANKVISMAGSKSKIVFCDLPQDDPCKRKPVIDTAKRELGWEPIVKLDDGLKLTYEYFKNLYKKD